MSIHKYHPIVVDLDGTLVQTDMLHESAIQLLRQNPLKLFLIIYWLALGKAILKKNLAKSFLFDPQSLPYNRDLIEWLKVQKASGKPLILCTASDRLIADSIANELQIFDQVLASDGLINLAGKSKAEKLVEIFGHKGFDYAGNSNDDLSVWKHAARAIVVNASNTVSKQASTEFLVDKEFAKNNSIFSLAKVLRIHQWLKNLLLFVPILAAHQLSNGAAWGNLIAAFFAFSFCASSVYIANDLIDLESDRQHVRKRNRPFASGNVEVKFGVFLSPLLILLSFYIASFVNPSFITWLALYFSITCIYSLYLKRIIILDCITLAILYTLRIVAGVAAASTSLSFWLFAFAGFLFLSLAFIKRYAELENQIHGGVQKIHGRGYYTTDASLIQTFGVTSGYAAVLVLALYLNSDAVLKLYQAPEMIWVGILVMLFWVSWMWMKAHRGQMHDDPLVFAVKDRASLVAGLIFLAAMSVGAGGFSS
jgi:4-hydroxybenzoate polyprenyltransferase/phosphoserine phosphatase